MPKRKKITPEEMLKMVERSLKNHMQEVNEKISQIQQKESIPIKKPRNPSINNSFIHCEFIRPAQFREDEVERFKKELEELMKRYEINYLRAMILAVIHRKDLDK